MYYSVTFIVDGVERNTWDNWQMIPNTPPMIAAPEPNLDMVEIPGRSRGPLDMSGVAFGKMTYKRMTGTWTFYKEPETQDTRHTFYDAITSFFNGKIVKVILTDEDPVHFYVGRFRVGTPSTSKGPMTIQLTYDLMPARWNVSDNTPDTSYGAEDVSTWVDPTVPPNPSVIIEWNAVSETVSVTYI